MAININRGVEDAFYRYKMPKLQAKVEGKGNGIKTVIVNATDIANSLSRKPIYVTKYFGCELGAQVNVDEKNERYIVNGAHDAAKLQNILDGFIKKFVLCQSCGNPETVLSVKNNNDVKTKCKACGASSILSRTHRLTQYIIKNPPKNEAPSSKKNGNAAEAKVNEEEEGASLIPETNDDSDDWGDDITEEAQRKRIEELTTMAQSMAMSTDVDKSSKEKVQIFLNYVTKNREEGTLMKNIKFIVAEADKLDLDTKAILVLIEGSLRPDSVVEDLKNYSELFKALIQEVSSRAKAELAVLAGIVLLIGLYKEKLLARSPLILKTLYDEDIVSEDVILKWSQPDFKLPSGILSKKIIKQYEEFCPDIISKSDVFIKWLQEAEEESSNQEESDEEDEESSEEEESEEQDSDDKNLEAVKDVTNATNTNEKTSAQPLQAEEDDLDIDAI